MINMFKTCHLKQEGDLLYHYVNYMIIYSAECLSQLSEDCADPNQLHSWQIRTCRLHGGYYLVNNVVYILKCAICAVLTPTYMHNTTLLNLSNLSQPW